MEGNWRLPLDALLAIGHNKKHGWVKVLAGGARMEPRLLNRMLRAAYWEHFRWRKPFGSWEGKVMGKWESACLTKPESQACSPSIPFFFYIVHTIKCLVLRSLRVSYKIFGSFFTHCTKQFGLWRSVPQFEIVKPTFWGKAEGTRPSSPHGLNCCWPGSLMEYDHG